ncbi:MAG: hypothetical protein FWF57_03465 [Defluviitaleaceae bacterium]|nr:hypothetical protein [Defluviitaleaceae bacterium]
MTQHKFNEIVNKKIFENNLTKLLEKIAEYPDRYVGLFRPTKPYAKIIQNISQSYEIRFGDALEAIFEEWFNYKGFENLPKKIKTKTDENLNIDLIFYSNKTNTIYMVEQKVRDDHDSTKKRGQYINFIKKYEIVEKLYKDKNITAIMWFVDDSLNKNKKYYESEIDKEILQKNTDKIKIVYGEDFFNISDELYKKSFWNEFIQMLEQWKVDIPNFPNVNFDDENNIQEVLKQISPTEVSNTVWKKLFEDDRITNEIFPVIFPNGLAFKTYIEIYDSNNLRDENTRNLMKRYIESIKKI